MSARNVIAEAIADCPMEDDCETQADAILSALRTPGYAAGAEAMREAVAVVLTSQAGQLRAAAERTWTDVELHSFISGKVGALEVALLAIRALPVPEEMQK